MIPQLLVLLTLSGLVSEADVLRLMERQLPRSAGGDSLRWSLATGWSTVALPKGATGLELVPPAGDPRAGTLPCMLRITGGGDVLRAVP